MLVVSSDNEGTPVAAIEAMAAGCPVVATRVGGVPDLITDRQNGILVPPDDPEAMANALLWSREHATDTRHWAESARGPTIQRHSVGALVARVDRIYRHLLTPN